MSSGVKPDQKFNVELSWFARDKLRDERNKQLNDLCINKCRPAMCRGVFIFCIPFMWFLFILLSWPYQNALFQIQKAPKVSDSPVFQENRSLTPWMKTQEERKFHVFKTCEGFFRRRIRKSYLSLARQRKRMFRHLVVDDIHRVLYCYIPKIACSNWKRIMIVLSGKTEATDPKDKRIGNPHNPGAFYRLDEYDLKSTAFKLKNYKKFMFVRDPFERLVSGYRNKFEVYTNTSSNFKVDYGSKMVKGFKMGDPIPFPNFVDYILSQDHAHAIESLNEHWATYDNLCHPCLVEYDFIGYYNTLEEDARNILHHIGAPANLTLPSQKSANTSQLLPTYLAQLSEKQTKGLYKVYERDFILFGYDKGHP